MTTTKFLSILLISFGLTLTGCGGSSSSGSSDGGVHKDLIGEYSSLFMNGSGAGCGNDCSFADGSSYNITLTKDTLTINDGTTTLVSVKDPVISKNDDVENPAEIQWTKDSLVYALSNNETGVFNDLNVGLKEGDNVKFLGQFKDPKNLDPTVPSYVIEVGGESINFDTNSLCTGRGLTAGASKNSVTWDWTALIETDLKKFDYDSFLILTYEGKDTLVEQKKQTETSYKYALKPGVNTRASIYALKNNQAVCSMRGDGVTVGVAN